MRICYVFPSRSRKHKFFKTLENIQDMCLRDENYFVWAKLDLDDETMNNDEVKKKLEKDHPEVTVKWGTSKNKIHACNRDLEDLPQCDIIILQSDDMVWTSFGYDDQIREAFRKHFPNLDGVVHFPEEKSANRTMVLTMIGINLYKELGYLYYPKYLSVYADNDLTEMTRLMGKYAYVNKKLYVHKHPIWGACEWDSQYQKWESSQYYKVDGHTFKIRKQNNFGL